MIHKVAHALPGVANLPALWKRVFVLQPDSHTHTHIQDESRTVRSEGSQRSRHELHSPLCSRVFPLRRLCVVIDKVDAIVGVDTAL